MRLYGLQTGVADRNAKHLSGRFGLDPPRQPPASFGERCHALRGRSPCMHLRISRERRRALISILDTDARMSAARLGIQ